jgi:hypothetical protein
VVAGAAHKRCPDRRPLTYAFAGSRKSIGSGRPKSDRRVGSAAELVRAVSERQIRMLELRRSFVRVWRLASRWGESVVEASEHGRSPTSPASGGVVFIGVPAYHCADADELGTTVRP